MLNKHEPNPTMGKEYKKMPETFEIEIVYNSNKPLTVTEEELIGAVKVSAMALFDIPKDQASSYQLRAKVEGKDVGLADGETVKQAKLHPHEKVTLAASAPYGFTN